VGYVYDGMRVIQERSSANTPQVSYTLGIDLSGSFEGAGGIGGLLGRSHAYQSGSGSFTNHNYYHADGSGNITYMVNTNQSMVASYRYDPFGNTISTSGTLVAANVYRFSSKEYMATGTSYYYGYRFYHPNLQRWLNRDAIGEGVGINLYSFVGNNPVSWGDPLELDGIPLPPGFRFYPPGRGKYGDFVPGDDLKDCLIRALQRKAKRDFENPSRLGKKGLVPPPIPGEGKCPGLLDRIFEAVHLAELSHGMAGAGERLEESQKVYDLDVWACRLIWGDLTGGIYPPGGPKK